MLAKPKAELQYTKLENDISGTVRKKLTFNDIASSSFLLLQEHPSNYKDMVETVMRGVQASDPLSKKFFSNENIQMVQKMIIKAIYVKSGGKFQIQEQDENDLLVVMRGVFFNEAKFLPNRILEQVIELDRKVVEQTVPGIMSNIKQQFSYIKDITKPRDLLDLPVNVSVKGTKTLPSIIKKGSDSGFTYP